MKSKFPNSVWLANFRGFAASLAVLVACGTPPLAFSVDRPTTVPATAPADFNVKSELRLKSLSSVIVRFSQKQDSTPPANSPDVGGKLSSRHLVVHSGVLESDCVYARLSNDYNMYAQKVTPQGIEAMRNAGEIVSKLDVASYTPKGIHRIIQQDKLAAQKQFYDLGKFALPGDSVIDVALGLRAYGAKEWITQNQMSGAAFKEDGDEIVMALARESKVTDVFTFSRKLGMAVTKYALKFDGKESVSISCKDFALVNGSWLPRQISMEGYWNKGGSREKIVATELRIEDFDFSSTLNTKEFYELKDGGPETVQNGHVVNPR